jgi:hypothetical protein
VLTAVVHSHKSGQTKNRYVQAHEWSIDTTVFSPKEQERDKHACMHMHVCMHVLTTAQPHLKGVRVLCCYYVANPSTVSVCLSVRVRPCVLMLVYPMMRCYICCNKHLMFGQTAVIHTHTYTHPHTFNTVTQAQSSVNSNEKHTHSLKR